MMTIATAFTQWVTRTQSGWMTAPVSAAGVKACSWVAPIDMAWLLQLSCNRATYSKFARAGRFTFPCRRRPPPSYVNPRLAGRTARSVRPNSDLVRHMSKTGGGNFFEDFRIGQMIKHAVPRTITVGDVALYNGLFGSRFAVQSSDVFARAIGYACSPVDDLLVFHVVFGKTVPDISLNAVANLGYAACRVLAPVYPGDTLNAESEVIGLKENSSRKTGIVFVRSTGCRPDGSKVLEYVRWVMVRKRDEAAPAPRDHVPRLPEAVIPTTLGDACPRIDAAAYDFTLAGGRYRFSDYALGEKIDHIVGITVEEAEHQIATRLY